MKTKIRAKKWERSERAGTASTPAKVQWRRDKARAYAQTVWKNPEWVASKVEAINALKAYLAERRRIALAAKRAE